jgi:pseudaminic acid synthase
MSAMNATGLRLRACGPNDEDARFLFELRNDPLSRRMSFDGAEIPWDRHRVWYQSLLADGDRAVWLAELDGARAGVIRYARQGAEATVSLALAPACRGRGLAARLLAEGERELRTRWPELTAVRAEIRRENAASLRAFAAAGFVVEAPREPDRLVYRRTLAPAPLFGGRHPIVIAELSANHGGSLTRALECIAAAAEAGADAIKLQTYTPDTMTLDSDRPEFRIVGGPWGGRTLYDLYREAHTPWAWHAELAAAARARGVPLFSTPFDATSVAFLETLGMPAYKVASFELTDHELLATIAATGKPVIASTGMATLAEIDEAVRIVRGVWGGRDPGLSLLRCVSAYPAEPRHMNLATIPELGRAFGVVPGLSDHTLGHTVAVAAVALGARVIEKHFTLRRADGGPDSAFSLEPAELRALCTAVREASLAVGEVRFGPTEGEAPNRLFRRSLFVAADLPAGAVFTRDNVRVVRPGHGLPPSALPLVLGRRAATALSRGQPIRWDLVA